MVDLSKDFLAEHSGGPCPALIEAIGRRAWLALRFQVLARVRVAHHGTGSVIDLSLLIRRNQDDYAGLRRERPAQLPHEALTLEYFSSKP